MDRDGVDAATLYPTPRLSHYLFATKDRGFHLAQIRAYNDSLLGRRWKHGDASSV